MDDNDPMVEKIESIEVNEPVEDKMESGQDDSNDISEEDPKDHIVEHPCPMRETSIRLPAFLGHNRDMHFNALTSFIGFAVLWGISIYCMARPAESRAEIISWRTSVADKFTWFYIGANPAFTFFLFWLAYRYGHIKLGADNEKPEFSNTSYFAMIFSAGVAVGLFFYGVSEPLWHRNSHWFAEAGYRSQDEIDLWALMLTCYHWGFAGWSPYVIMAIAAGLASYRFGLPMTVRSGMYTMFGPYTWGWIGDVIDGFSIVTTVGGICTSLGLGTMQIVTGSQRLGWIDPELEGDELLMHNITVIIVVTLIATASVVSGLHIGIQLLSQIGFGIGMVLLMLILIMEKTNFLMNLFVQVIGYYFQWALFLVPFWTDAFGQLQPGEGRAAEGASATWWMDAWTVFYMAWWTAWAAFVGLFVARISRGRTIREVVMYCFVAPMIYSFLWFTVFGGAGLRQARQAEELIALGEAHYNSSTHFQSANSDYCYDVPQEPVVVDGETIFTNTLPGVTPVCVFESSTESWFNVMFSFSYPSNGFQGFGSFLSGLSIFAVTIYFITSSDSGSLVVDHLASNGHKDHHWVQRVFWAFTEGAVAIALLVAGGADALQALQAASIVFGLPLCLFLFFMCGSIVSMSSHAEANPESDELPDPHRKGASWEMPIFGGIFNIFEFLVSLGSVHPERVKRGMHMPTSFQIVQFVKGLLVPFVSLYQVYTLMDVKGEHKMLNIFLTVSYTLIHFAWIAFFGASAINWGFAAFAFTAFFTNGCIITALRMRVRERFNITGNIIGDFFAGSFGYPQALCQMLLQFEVDDEKEYKA